MLNLGDRAVRKSDKWLVVTELTCVGKSNFSYITHTIYYVREYNVR